MTQRIIKFSRRVVNTIEEPESGQFWILRGYSQGQQIVSGPFRGDDDRFAKFTEFIYTNRGPSECNPPTPVNVNLIRLWMDQGRLYYSRHYVRRDRTHCENGIVSSFDNLTPLKIAQGIHWGCCGWSAEGHQIPELVGKVDEFLQNAD